MAVSVGAISSSKERAHARAKGFAFIRARLCRWLALGVAEPSVHQPTQAA